MKKQHALIRLKELETLLRQEKEKTAAQEAEIQRDRTLVRHGVGRSRRIV